MTETINYKHIMETQSMIRMADFGHFQNTGTDISDVDSHCLADNVYLCAI